MSWSGLGRGRPCRPSRSLAVVVVALTTVSSVLLPIEAASASQSASGPVISVGAVSTFAGSGVDAHVDGTGSAASFQQMGGIVVVAGYAYVGTSGAIRKVNLSTGAVTTLAGDGSTSSCVDSSTGSSVRFKSVTDVATDGTYLYVTTYCSGSSNRLRRVEIATGATTTLTSGVASPSRLAYQGGSLWVAEGSSVTQRSITTGAVVSSTSAGASTRGLVADSNQVWVSTSNSSGSSIVKMTYGSPPTVSTFASVSGNDYGLASDALLSAGGYLYVVVYGDTVRRYDQSNGSMVNIAGAGTGYVDGTGTDAWFSSEVNGLAGDGTSIWVADWGNRRVRKIVQGTALPSSLPAAASSTLSVSPARLTTIAGNGAIATVNGTGTAASFTEMGGVVVVGGNAYIGTTTTIRKVNLSTGAVTTFAGHNTQDGCVDSPNPSDVRLQEVSSLTTDGYYLYSTTNGCSISASGYVRRTSLATGATDTLAKVGVIRRLTYGPDGNLYVSVQGGTIYRMDRISGVSSTFFTSSLPVVAVSADAQHLWVASGSGVNRPSALTRVAMDGTAVTVASSPNTFEFAYSSLASAGDYLYGARQLSDGSWRLQRIIKDTGSVTTIAGSTAGSYMDAIGSDAWLAGAYNGLVSDGTSLWMADTNNYRFRKIEAVKGPTTGGGPTRPGETLGPNNPAELSSKTCAADPISTDTGNFFECYTDLTIPGRGPALELRRTYNSLWASHDSRFGWGWTDSYNMSLVDDPYTPNTKNVLQETGAQVSFLWNGSAYTTASRVFATLVLNGNGTYTFTRNKREVFTFNAAGQLTRIEDLNNNATVLAYTAGKLTTVTDPGGRTLTYTYNGSNRVGSVSDSAGRSVSYGYNATGELTSVTDVRNGVTQFGYGSNHLLTTVTDPRNHVITTNVYDSARRVISQTNALNHTTTLAYAIDGTVTITDPRLNVIKQQYVDGRLTSETEGFGSTVAATTSYTYDAATNGIATVTDGRNQVTSFTYDSNGNVLTVTNPLNHTTTSTYDALNNVLTTTDPRNQTTTYTYDTRGNRLTESRPLNGTTTRTTTWQYTDINRPGDVTAIIDPRSKTTGFTYDSAGNLTQVTDPNGNITKYGYDSAGRRTTMIAPNGNVSGATPSQWTTTYAVNAFGDITSITNPLAHVTSYGYDANRNKTSATDAQNNQTTYTYDQANRLTTVTRADTTTLINGYDAANNLTGQTDGANRTTSYTYDARNRVATMTDPLNRTTSYGYDANSNQTRLTDPSNAVTTRVYDNANRLTGINYDGTTPDVTFTYDNANRRTQMIDGTGTSTYGYDNLDRLTSSTNGNNKTVGYSYDLAGNTTGITYPNNNSISRTFDNGGRLTGINDWLSNTSTFGYDHNGNLTSRTLGNGTTSTYTYNRADENTAISHVNSGGTFASFTYTRNNNAHLTGVTQAGVPGPISESYGYSPLTQLSDVSSNTLTYDTADNPTKLASATHQAFDNANQVCWTAPTSGSSCSAPPTSATTYTYDSRGNRTVKTPPSGGATTAYGYDQAKRLTSVGTNANYAYDGDGLRASKTVNSTTTNFAWGVNGGLPLMLHDGTSDYVYGPDSNVLVQITGTGEAWHHADQLGSTRSLTTGVGSVAGAATYDANGTTTGTTGTFATAMGWAGEYRDNETGFIYLRARYYDPVTAQFLTRDPLVAQTREALGYVGGNPLNRTDPSGLEWFDPRDWDQDVVSWAENRIENVADLSNQINRRTPGGRLLIATSQATGLTLGVCGEVGILGGTHVTGGLCYLATPDGNSGYTVTAGEGAGGTVSASALLGVAVGNAQRRSDLAGSGDYVTSGFGEGKASAGFSLTTSGSCNLWTVGWAPGARLPVPPVSGAKGRNFTWTLGWSR